MRVQSVNGPITGGALLPLGLLAEGETGELAYLPGRGGHGQRRGMGPELARLEEMGLRPGALVEVLGNEGHGPLLLRVGETRIAIGRGVAMKIQVRPTHGGGRGGGCAGACRGRAR